MKELIEQYKRIQNMKTSLHHVKKDMPGLVSDEAIQLINDQLNAKLDSLAHQITNLFQDNPPNEPEPLCPRRVVATAAVVMQQSMSFLIETLQMKLFPHDHAQRHADTIHLLKQSAGTEVRPYKTIAVKDLEL